MALYEIDDERKKGKVTVIKKDGKSKGIIPSYVVLQPEKLVGQKAKEISISRPGDAIYHVKRLMGRNFSDEAVQDDMKRLPYKVNVASL